MHETALVISAHNEAKGNAIGRFLKSVHRRLDGAEHLRIIVVDDGSTDDTVRIARQYAHVITPWEERRGKGSAIKIGFDYVLNLNNPRVQRIVTSDADLQHRAGDIEKIIAALRDDSDMAIGARFAPGSKLVGAPGSRLINNIQAALMCIAYGQRPFHDARTGLMGFQRWLLEKIVPKLTLPGYGGPIDIIICALEIADKHPLTIAQVPIPARYKHVSKPHDEKLDSQLGVKRENERSAEMAANINELFGRRPEKSVRRLLEGLHYVNRAVEAYRKAGGK